MHTAAPPSAVFLPELLYAFLDRVHGAASRLSAACGAVEDYAQKLAFLGQIAAQVGRGWPATHDAQPFAHTCPLLRNLQRGAIGAPATYCCSRIGSCRYIHGVGISRGASVSGAGPVPTHVTRQAQALDTAAGEVHAVYALLEEYALPAPAEDRWACAASLAPSRTGHFVQAAACCALAKYFSFASWLPNRESTSSCWGGFF